MYLVKMINKDSGIRSNEARTVESENRWKMIDVAYVDKMNKRERYTASYTVVHNSDVYSSGATLYIDDSIVHSTYGGAARGKQR